jgi:hypothetical protein
MSVPRSALRGLITGSGYTTIGSQYEIYLGDPRRIAAEKLRIVIGQPIAARRDVIHAAFGACFSAPRCGVARKKAERAVAIFQP